MSSENKNMHFASGPELFASGAATDLAFSNLRDGTDDCQIAARSFVEQLWDTYCSYADDHFLTEISRDFNAWFWEMYLTCALLEHAPKRGYALSCPKPGPDICLQLDAKRIWVEAISVTNGRRGKPDSLQEPANGSTICAGSAWRIGALR
jgi:hypothetical protein